MAVVASATGAAVFGLSGVAAGLAGGALLGAGAGALYSGITGDGNILNSALTGALLGGAAGGIGAAFAPAAAVTTPTALASAPISTALTPTANALTATPALTATKGTLGATALSPTAAASQQALFGLGATSQGAVPAASTFGLTGAPTVAKAAGLAAPASAATSFAPVVTGSVLPAGYGAGSAATGMSGSKMLGYGLAGTTALSLLGGRQQGPGAGQMPDPGMVRPYEYSSTPSDPTGMYPNPYATAEYTESGNPILDTRERNYFSQNFAPMQPYSAKTGTVNPNEPFKMAAAGGLMFDDESGMDDARGIMQGNLQKGLFGRGYAEGGPVKHMFGGGLSAMISKLFQQNPEMLMPKYEYDNASQRYNTVNQMQDSPNNFLRMFGGAMQARESGLPAFRFDPGAQEYQALAVGGHLGGYSDGGRMLKGPGDGMSDDIPGVIGNKQPARLADGEFVVPADVVSHLGNGSTDAGAKRLYAMMDEVRKARTGNKKQGKKIKAEKYLPA